jgi:transcriptional regulator with AAA-type ATPase domain
VLPPKRLSEAARDALLGYPWPGNVRELANVMERVALLVDGVVIQSAELDLTANRSQSRPEAGNEPTGPLRASVQEFERAGLASALAEAGGPPNGVYGSQPQDPLIPRSAELGAVYDVILESGARSRIEIARWRISTSVSSTTAP